MSASRFTAGKPPAARAPAGRGAGNGRAPVLRHWRAALAASTVLVAAPLVTSEVVSAQNINVAVPISAPNVTITNLGTDSITVSATVDATSMLSLSSGRGGIILNGNLSGATVDLSATGGGVVQTAGQITASTILQSSSGVTGPVDLLEVGNNITAIGNFAVTSGDFILVNNGNTGLLTVSGPLSAANVTISNANTGSIRVSGSIGATGTLSLSSGSVTIDPGAVVTTGGGYTETAGTTTNNGTINGTVTVSGGVLTQTAGLIAGGLTNGATVNANGGAINGAIANNAGTFNIGGAVTSNSTFANASSATLAIGSAGTYTLQGLLTNNGIVTVANGGQLVATAGGITNAAGGSMTVASGGTVKDDLNNAGTVTNNGTYIANVATNTGTITNNAMWTGNVLSNANTIVNGSGATWAGNISNGGAFTNAGTVTGNLTSTAGTATNNGTITGAVSVSGGTFTGTGSTGSLTIAGGSTFAPGNGTPGTSATINGSLAFQSGAFYLIGINPATSSFATATGAATLGGGSVFALFSSGTYVAKQYTILSAAGGVGGTFNTLANTNLPSGFTSTLSYDATHAYLNLALNFAPLPNSGLSVNQQGVANAIVNFFNTNGTIPIAFGALSSAGLTQVSGELGTGSQQTTFQAMNQFMGVMTDPFIDGRGDGLSSGGTTATGYADVDALAYAAKRKPNDALAAIYRKAPPPVTPFEARWSTWVAGYGGSQSTNGSATLGSNNTSSSVYGTAVGADYRFSPFTLAGFALAGGGTNFSGNGLGSGRSDLFQAGAFMRHTVGPAYISAALAYGWQDITTDRTVTIAGVDRLRAEFNANAYSGRVEGGYRFVSPWIGGVGLTPYAAGQFTTFDLPAYAEQVLSGANTFALAYGSKSVADTRSELGLRTDKSFAMQDSILTLRGRFAWAHDFNPDRSIGATFQTLPGASFVVNGAAQAPDSALTTASAEVKWRNGWSAAAIFEGEFSEVTRSYAGKGVVRYAW
jgi:fibronectin-binding autotransporter adhesin